MVLGPLEVLDGDRAVRLGSAKQRLLLGALLVHANQVVSVDRLADIIWGDDQPADPAGALQTYVSRLRSTLEPKRSKTDPDSVLLTRAPGYLLRVEAEQLDATRFARTTADGQRAAATGDSAAAVALLDEALALWRGDAYAEFADQDFSRTDALQLEELRRVAVEERIEAKLGLGLHAELIGELEGIVAAEPLRERPRAQLMVALYRSGRDAEALRAYQDFHRYLGDELGVVPSTSLQQLEREIVDQRPDLRAPASEPTAPPPPAARATEPAPPARPARSAPPTRPPEHLVGRTGELDALRGWMSDALGGTPRIAVVLGEAGVGKSHVTNALIDEARAAGVRPFVGRCVEGSDLPLLPVASILDVLGVRTGEPAAGASPVAPDEHGSRLRTVVHASRALLDAANDQPALLVLEDAQWADPATIELVTHLSATFAHEAVYQQLPVMLVVTARPATGSPEARRLLLRLSHEVGSQTLTLAGLDEIATFALVSARTGTRPSNRMLRLVREATHGNPRAIETVLGRLEQANALEVRDGEVVVTRDELVTVPADADLAAASRLAALSAESIDVLTTAAMLRDPTLDRLRRASELGPDAVDDSLDDAIAAGLVTDDGVRAEIVDTAVRRALVDRGSGRRRRRLHAMIARHLADSPSAPGDDVEITEQLLRAGSDSDPELIARHAKPAGDAALALGGWSDASRYYDAALDASSDDAERARLARDAATAAYRSNDPRAAAAHADEAIRLSRQAGDLGGWGEAVLLHSRTAFVAGASRERRSAVALLEEFLAAADDDVPALRARAHATLAEIASTQLRHDSARTHAITAAEIAAGLDDAGLDARVEFVTGLERFGALDLDAASRHFRRSEERARTVGDTLIEAWALGRAPLLLWSRGELDAAEAAASTALRHDREHGWWGEYALVAAIRAGIAVARGNLAAVERVEADAASAIEHGEMAGAGTLLWPAVAGARSLRGDALGAHRALDEWEREDVRGVARSRDLVDAVTDDATTPHAENLVPLSSFVRPGAPLDVTTIGLAASDVELADTLGRPDLAVDALPILAAGYERGVRFVAGWCLFVPRLAGVACLLAGDHADAQQWLERAMTDAEHAGAAGEAARATYDLARAKLEAGDATGTTDLLSRAIGELERLGYRELLGSARSLAGLPGAGDAEGAGTRVILVTDLVDSTPLNQRLGNELFLELLREHNRIVRDQLRAFDGVEFKHTGDGIAAWFFNAETAVRCALAIHRSIEGFNAARADPVHIRIGLASGEVICDEGDLFGLAVVEAFRICDHARDGHVLVSSAVAERAAVAGLTFESIGDVTLKGFASPQALVAVKIA
jgi:DNA-binding SARP family transcriptional activator/class 3 adenylate cyclase